MRRLLILALLLAATPWVAAQLRAASAPTTAPISMLTVDGIMRGPKLVGSAPTAVRWSKDSSRIYFSWQKPDQDRASTYVVNRDGTGLRQLTPDEARTLDVAPAGRFDRARKRLLAVENGDVVIYDAASAARRVITRTAVVESNPRWAQNDTAITFVRDGNLYLMSLDGSSAPSFAAAHRHCRGGATDGGGDGHGGSARRGRGTRRRGRARRGGVGHRDGHRVPALSEGRRAQSHRLHPAASRSPAGWRGRRTGRTTWRRRQRRP